MFGKIRPRLHGNGFIQCDLGPELRLNVWDREVMRKAQRVNTGIHDHRFAFTSTVIVGAIRHTEYEITPSRHRPAYVTFVVRPRDGEDTELISLGNVVRLKPVRILIPHQGESYSFDPARIHSTEPMTPLAVTLMFKTRNVPAWEPRVFVPFGQLPDNEFNRHQVSSLELAIVVRKALAFLGDRFE